MKTNSFFSYDRFMLLVKQDLMINRNKYLLTFLAFAMGLYAFLVFQINDEPIRYSFQHGEYRKYVNEGHAYVNLFIMVLIGYGAFIGMAFSGLGEKAKCNNYLLIPASTFEKYLYPVVFRMLMGLLVFTSIFWFDAQLARFTLMNTPTFVSQDFSIVPFDMYMLFNTVSGSFNNVEGLLTLVFIGIFLLVAPLFFKKYALIKTIVCFFIVIFLFVVINVGLSHLFDPNLRGFKFSFHHFQIVKNIYFADLVLTFIVAISGIFLLFIGYFKLKERQL